MYLAFNWFTSQILFFYGRAAFCRTWLEGTYYLLVQGFCSTLSGAGLKPTSLSADFCPKTPFFSQAGERRVFGIRSARPFTAISVLKTKFFIPISADEKGTTSGVKASTNHLAPSSSSTSSGHATQWPAFLLRPPGYGVKVVWPYPGCP